MSSKEKRRYLMEQESVPKALLKLGLPTMVGMMTSGLYNLVDTYFVSTLGTSQTAAVSVAFPISVMLLAIGLLYGTGASSYLARLLGDRRYKEANICFSTTLVTALGTAIVVVVLMLIFLTPLLSVLGATDTIMPYAREFGSLFIIGLFFNVFNIAVNNMIAAEGATNYSMLAMLSGGVANIILDPILIFKLHMGVRGAAVATLISRCISVGLYLYYLCSGKSNFRFSFSHVCPNKALYQEIFKIGVPMFCYQILCSVALSATNLEAKTYGDAAVAGIGVANRMLSLGNMMLVGFMKGYQPFTGFNYGARRYERVRKATRLMLLWATGLCVTAGVSLILLRVPLMHAFTKTDAEMVSVGGKALLLNGITFMGFGYVMVYNFLFLALGRAKEGGAISVSRQGLFFLPLLFVLPIFWGLNGVLLAQPIADVLTLLMVVAMTCRRRFLSDQEGNPLNVL